MVDIYPIITHFISFERKYSPNPARSNLSPRRDTDVDGSQHTSQSDLYLCILLLLNLNIDPPPTPREKTRKRKQREKARNYRIREDERYLSLTLSECKVGYFEAVDHFLNNGLWTRRGAGHNGVKVLEVVHVDVRMFGQEKHNGRGDVQRCDL